MATSKEELISIAQKYYNSNGTFLFATEPSPETKRRQALWKQWIANMGPWYTFKDELRSALPGYIIGETYPSADGGPRCTIYMPKTLWSREFNWDVVSCVSLLAPVYFVYGVAWDYVDGRRQNFRASFDHPPLSMARPTQVAARVIEKMFGFTAFPRELVDTPVSLYAGLLEPPETTLFHALFTNAPSSIP